eukprot:CAMPEP_0201562796 /NCGR_PEP_ID=MMETSP0173_2-20130828/79525_1 /ASSEMBLY_ACC=CAM_ASM_000268 /TAXON_ID=218659 /ORGANISM="Vexillifera sp., Strain DIVA3 564/2" /LENGTH=283 /DNA_ID=CAMNT_0047977397 /DNA_START=481 /DNA_END=1329 /DNA_ORIENTATION=-
MIRIARESQKKMQKRRIGVLQKYFEKIANLLWPRFSDVFKLHLDSVSEATPSSLGSIDIQPHYVTRRYSELLASILSLKVKYSDHRLAQHLNALRHAMEQLIKQIAKTIKTSHKDPRDAYVFLINNYYLVLSILNKWQVISDDTYRFQELLHHARKTFVDLELASYFRPMIQIVKGKSRLTANNAQSKERTNKVVLAYKAAWEQSVKSISKDVLGGFFPNFENGQEVLRMVLAQLEAYHSRFNQVVEKAFPALKKNLVPVTTLTFVTNQFDVDLGDQIILNAQ